MDFRFLLDPRRKLLSLGFEVESGKHASACYDLLASEARIAVFVAIAKEDIPQDVWFLLGRSHTPRARISSSPLLDRDHVRVPDAGTGGCVPTPIRFWTTRVLPHVRLQQIFGTDERACPGEFLGIGPTRNEMRAGSTSIRRFGLPDISLHQGDPNALVIFAPIPRSWHYTSTPTAALAQSATNGRRWMARPVRVLPSRPITAHYFWTPLLEASPRTGALLDGPPSRHEPDPLWPTSYTMAWFNAGFMLTAVCKLRSSCSMKSRQPT